MAAIIEVRDLGKTYEVGNEKIYALKHIDFVVESGEFIAIMGQSGSGKSTLMNLLGCLDTPSEGKYFINGREVSALSEDELAYIRNKEIGFIFQVFHLLPRSTALHNVELPLVYGGVKKAARGDAMAVAALASLSGFLAGGLFDTQIDAPRFLMLMLLLAWASF